MQHYSLKIIRRERERLHSVEFSERYNWHVRISFIAWPQLKMQGKFQLLFPIKSASFSDKINQPQAQLATVPSETSISL